VPLRFFRRCKGPAARLPPRQGQERRGDDGMAGRTGNGAAPSNRPVLTASLLGTAVEFHDFYTHPPAASPVFPGPVFPTRPRKAGRTPWGPAPASTTWQPPCARMGRMYVEVPCVMGAATM